MGPLDVPMLRLARNHCKAPDGSMAPAQVLGGLVALINPVAVTASLAIRTQVNETTDDDGEIVTPQAVVWEVIWLTESHLAQATARRNDETSWSLPGSQSKPPHELSVHVWPVSELLRVSVTQVDAYLQHDEWSAYPVYEAALRDGTLITIPSLAESAERPFVEKLLAALGLDPTR